ncbi:MAG: hypothetical protein H6744_16530 [Deltaproteobacteria bacterium]|nr:hypothetical protein [Deltaproteobacteria bacterium]MCB9788287.1 hypothetical protein [Deltaproteobacteria bacterium]
MRDATETPRSSRGAGIVITVVFTLATVLGVVAYWRYSVSSRFIHESLAQFDARGASLDADACVGEVLAWNARCEAMKSMCDQAVPMTMEHCLAARERKEACAALPVEEAPRAQWTFERCAAQGVTRRNKNVCTDAYRALVQFCRTGERGVIL